MRHTCDEVSAYRFESARATAPTAPRQEPPTQEVSEWSIPLVLGASPRALLISPACSGWPSVAVTRDRQGAGSGRGRLDGVPGRHRARRDQGAARHHRLYGRGSPLPGHRAIYQHRRINHSEKVYVSGDVHTNTIEGFWATVKGGIGGAYHALSTRHLRRTWMSTCSATTTGSFRGDGMFQAFVDRTEKD